MCYQKHFKQAKKIYVAVNTLSSPPNCRHITILRNKYWR